MTLEVSPALGDFGFFDARDGECAMPRTAAAGRVAWGRGAG